MSRNERDMSIEIAIPAFNEEHIIAETAGEVVRAMPDGPQGLPDHAPPVTCFDPADCPADLPGCPAYAALRPACSGDRECATGRCAWDGYCEGASEDADELDVAVRKAIRGARSAKASTPNPR